MVDMQGPNLKFAAPWLLKLVGDSSDAWGGSLVSLLRSIERLRRKDEATPVEIDMDTIPAIENFLVQRSAAVEAIVDDYPDLHERINHVLSSGAESLRRLAHGRSGFGWRLATVMPTTATFGSFSYSALKSTRCGEPQ